MARRERVASTRRAFTPRRVVQALSQQGGAAASLQWPATATLDLPFDTPAESWLALHSDSSDARALERLAMLAHDYTPRVSHEESDAVLLEVRGSFRLFGGAHALCRQILERSLQLSLHVSWALAPTPLAALALARARQNVIVASRERLVGLLSPLPVAVLRWPDATIERLESIGVRTLGALLRLPRAGFAQRFGQPALQMLDQLTGAVADLRRPHRLRERFCVRGEPSFELQTDTVLLQHLTPLLAELERFLCLRQAGIEALQLRLRHRPPSADTRLTLRFAVAQWQADACRELLALQLSRKRLPAPVVAYELRSGAIRPRVTCSASLWRGNEQGAGVAAEVPALIERLRARLGDESVYGLCLVPEHRPERAWRIAEPHAPAKPSSVGTTYDTTTRRPLWLLQQPRALPCALSQLQLLEGPERIETGWWDGGEVARDYYIACNRDGSRLWIYRERSAPHAWYWHGVFA